MIARKIIPPFLFFSLAFFLVFKTVLAQTPTEKTPQTPKDKIEELKERVATKVAQMRSQIFKALVGEISVAEEESFLLKTGQGEKKILLTSETKIYRITRGKRAAISTSNLKTGERAAAIGSTDAEGEFVAKVVLVKSLPQNINGQIERIDPKKFTLSVKNTQNQTTYLVDVETTTKIQTWKKDEGLEKAGFSKLFLGDRVHLNGIETEEENRLSALRILALPGLSTGITGGVVISPTIIPLTSPKTPTPTPTP